MKKLFFLLTIALISIAASAQNSQKAKELLDEVSSKINTYQNIVIDFSYSFKNANGDTTQESKGNIAIQQEKYVLDFMGMKKISDGKLVYTISPEDEEVTISKASSNNTESLLPSDILTFFNKGYSFHWDIIQNVKGRKIQYIKLVPTTATSTVKEVFLGIDAQTKTIYNKIDVAKDGSKSVLTVNSFKTNQAISKNHFTFTESKYPNYYINKIDWHL